jgi:hypothetical protein
MSSVMGYILPPRAGVATNACRDRGQGAERVAAAGPRRERPPEGPRLRTRPAAPSDGRHLDGQQGDHVLPARPFNCTIAHLHERFDWLALPIGGVLPA